MRVLQTFSGTSFCFQKLAAKVKVNKTTVRSHRHIETAYVAVHVVLRVQLLQMLHGRQEVQRLRRVVLALAKGGGNDEEAARGIAIRLPKPRERVARRMAGAKVAVARSAPGVDVAHNLGFPRQPRIQVHVGPALCVAHSVVVGPKHQLRQRQAGEQRTKGEPSDRGDLKIKSMALGDAATNLPSCCGA